MNTNISKIEPVKSLKFKHVMGMVLLGLLPSLVTMILWQRGVSAGIDYGPTTDLTNYPIELSTFVLFKTLIFASSLMVAILCFLQFKETGRIVKPILAVPLLAGGLMELVRALVLMSWLPNNSPHVDFIPMTRIVSDGLMLFYLCLLPVVFLVMDTVRGKKQQDRATQWAVGMTIALVGFSLWLMHIVSQSDAARDVILRGPFTRYVFDWLPLCLAVFLGVFVMPTYVQAHRSIFVQSVWISCLPMGLASLQFALMDQAGSGLLFTTANMAKLVGYVIPAVGLILEYRWAYHAMKENNRALQDQSFLSFQLNENAHHQERYMTHVMANIDNPVCIYDASFRVIKINAMALQVAGRDSDKSVIGSTIQALFSPPIATMLIQTGKQAGTQPNSPALSDAWTARIGQEVRTYQWCCTALKDEAQNVVGILGVGREVRV